MSAFVGGFGGAPGVRSGRAAAAREAVVMGVEARVDRRAALRLGVAAAIAAAAAGAAPQLARADGAVSGATRNRARNLYGSRVLDLTVAIEQLPSLVDSGDWVKVSNVVSSDKKKPGFLTSEKNAFDLFVSGGWAGYSPEQKALTGAKNIMFQMAAQLERAAKNKDKSAGKKAAERLVASFNEFKAVGEIMPNPFESEPGQKWSSDFAYSRKMGSSPYLNAP
eukprot:CAMPEP_0185833042 /NCGR_PEP_ID=MMETSP1353-20130828/2443_1 /TAXON_ID=1077150 /ORGANISM="Erythrolobus australicus, Strain CCMP3124" /LENGTH=221 /DNA_ID=CAMNT_0028531287 /DNA_START=59 /DNA_END=724 /DNA_ORIENTATION=-